jgi:polyphosphate kinase 2 (PPK2 family)
VSGKNGGPKLPKQVYEREVFRLQGELVKMQGWMRASGARVIVIFEGRDAAGKGGTIQRVAEFLNPRFATIAALSPMDLESITHWEDYSRAKDEMFVHTDIPEAPWHVLESDDKRSARVNMISHLLRASRSSHGRRSAWPGWCR